ncbi:gamma-glutamyltransferase [Cupriavidus sp. USMAA2-4]|uniref:Gamma-glutamyltransferase n=1 Tax=Cupriavidus malaysiensis TaxID=367825 RepID=A0ABN4TNQ4_9BURK|nr:MULTISPECIES: gamma-glutamyltransferase family protein [Cupriavidus]AOY95803.1 gamma-glutamyltransferase [Cupriavidus sp. USMAA2-4]AOZ03682.1 gamma-glutamyltransferase [Cupriavidus sp. USMAHM13]AOZ08953.1 gamma-glutamyltransferase [Cupriavidus malaysiensis]
MACLSPANSALAESSAGMVTSPHALASEAGLEVLRAGGNAIEAAIAIGATLAVTYPHFTGLGGDAFWLLSDGAGQVRGLSGIGQAAAALPAFDGAIPQRGGAAALTSAATVDTWARAYAVAGEWGGRLGWSELFRRAIDYAHEGFALTPSQHFWQSFRRQELAGWAGFADTFLPHGSLPAVGSRLRQPALGRSLERIATHGAREFYEGELAARIVAGLRAAGSPLTRADLAATAAREAAPLRVSYRGGELLSLPPPTQGVTTLQILGVLERFDVAALAEGSADYYHLLVEAVKEAFIERNRYVADPDFAEVPVADMLSPARLDAMARRIDPQRALSWPHVYQHGDTVYLAAVDRQGRCASVLQTIYFDWGSGVVAGDTGILWHNRGAAFHTDPAHHNAIGPGKRPFHTLNPGMYLREGRPRLLYGTQGADGQPQTLAAVLTRLIDYGMDPLSALARPRFLLGRTFSDARDSLKLEADAGAQVMAELAARGHEISEIPAQSPLAGHPGVIAIDADGRHCRGAHDPRSDGVAMGL